MSSDQGGVTSLVDLYDSDVLRIELVLHALQTREGKTVSLEGFRKEAIDRFADAGFKVNVKMWTSTVEGVYIPEIEIVERIEPVTFDPDRQVHEVTNDLLGLGEGGVIKTDAKGGVLGPKDR